MVLHIKKGDTVLVLSGKDKGKKGKVIRVIPARRTALAGGPKDGKVVVEKVNIAKRHQRPTKNFPGGIIEKPLPLFVAKVKLVCQRCGKPTRIGSQVSAGKKVRICKRCGEALDKV